MLYFRGCQFYLNFGSYPEIVTRFEFLNLNKNKETKSKRSTEDHKHHDRQLKPVLTKLQSEVWKYFMFNGNGNTNEVDQNIYLVCMFYLVLGLGADENDNKWLSVYTIESLLQLISDLMRLQVPLTKRRNIS